MNRSPLYTACRGSHANVVKLLIEHNADLLVTNKYRWTHVNAASAEGRIEAVKLLLEHDADISMANIDRMIPCIQRAIDSLNSAQCGNDSTGM